MGQTFKKQSNKFDDDIKAKNKRANHANNRKTNGMKVVNEFIFEEFEKHPDYDYKYDYEDTTL